MLTADQFWIQKRSCSGGVLTRRLGRTRRSISGFNLQSDCDLAVFYCFELRISRGLITLLSRFPVEVQNRRERSKGRSILFRSKAQFGRKTIWQMMGTLEVKNGNRRPWELAFRGESNSVTGPWSKVYNSGALDALTLWVGSQDTPLTPLGFASNVA